MRFEVLANFFGQPVEVGVIHKVFSGIIRQSELDDGLNDVVELEPLSDYYKKRYGVAILDVDTITSIRVIRPHTDDDDEDCCKAEDY